MGACAPGCRWSTIAASTTAATRSRPGRSPRSEPLPLVEDHGHLDDDDRRRVWAPAPPAARSTCAVFSTDSTRERSAQRSESRGQTIQDLVRRLALQAALVGGLLIWMVVLRIVGGGSCASSTSSWRDHRGRWPSSEPRRAAGKHRQREFWPLLIAALRRAWASSNPRTKVGGGHSFRRAACHLLCLLERRLCDRVWISSSANREKPLHVQGMRMRGLEPPRGSERSGGMWRNVAGAGV